MMYKNDSLAGNLFRVLIRKDIFGIRLHCRAVFPMECFVSASIKPRPAFLQVFSFIRNQEIGEFYVIPKRRATDFEAPKLRKQKDQIMTATC